MAKSTYLELSRMVQSEVGESGVPMSSVVSGSTALLRIAQWVSKGDLETQARWLDWDFMHVGTWSATTSIGVAAVSAPTDIGVWDEDSFYLDYNTATHSRIKTLDYPTWRAMYRQGVKPNQRPTIVAIKPDRSLILESPPDAAYLLTADYWKRPTKLAVDADTSTIPEEFERIIVARAKLFYGEFHSAAEIISGASAEYDDLLDKLEAKYLANQMNRRKMDTSALVVRPA